MSRLKLATAAPETKDETREALRAAIAAADETRGARDRLKAALERARRIVETAEACVQETDEGVYEAESQAEADLVAAIRAGADVATHSGLAEARRRHEKAQSDLALAGKALAVLQAEHDAIDVAKAEGAVEAAAKAVMFAAAGRMVERALEMREAYVDQIHLLSFLRKECGPHSWRGTASEIEERIESFLAQPLLGAPGGSYPLSGEDVLARTGPLRAALEALKKNPDAPVPSVG